MTLEEAIIQKYIRPTTRTHTLNAGLEFELPIVNLKKQPVDFDLVHQLTDLFLAQFGFSECHYDDDGHIYSASHRETGDCISFDCSYNTLEFSFGISDNLNIIYRRFVTYYTFIQDFLLSHGHTLTGMGINPHWHINRNEPIPNGRYRMLLHHLKSYEKYGDAIPFHPYPNFGLFSCASQVQLDAEEGTLLEVLNTFTKLEPLKALLFANSPWGNHNELLCARDQFWRNSLHGLNRHNVDMYQVEFHSENELVNYIKSTSLYCLERDGKYINFPPTPLTDYFAAKEITGEYFDGAAYQSITFQPRLDDLNYLRTFKFEDVTYRGTVEFRSVCEQPVCQIMAPGAFHAGLMHNLPKLTRLLQQDTVLYQRGYTPSELRMLLNRRELPGWLDRKAVSRLLTEVLDIATEGLLRRGTDEAHFLLPLYERAQTLTSPAREMADGLDAGLPLEHFIRQFAAL